MKDLKIIELKSENFKKIKAVNITPNDDTVFITGANEQGKSSVLDAIEVALCGAGALKNTPDPIRHGADSSIIELDLGDIKVRRSITPSNTYIRVTSADGQPVSSPQELLDKLYNRIAVDPSNFMRMDNKKQLQVFKQITGLGEKMAALDAKRLEFYNERTDVNREIKRLVGVRDQNDAAFDNFTNTNEIDVESIRQKLNNASQNLEAYNAKVVEYNVIGNKYKSNQSRISSIDEQIATLIKEKDELQKELADLKTKGIALKNELSSMDKPNIEVLTNELNNAMAHNTRVKEYKAHLNLLNTITEYSLKSDKLTELIESIDIQKGNLLQDAEFPIKGLSFNEDEILFNGIPLIQASQEEKIRISMAIAMATNPIIKVILIRDASLFDSKNLQIIQQIAKENNYQLWLERVDDSGEVGVVIEEGRVKAIDGVPFVDKKMIRTKSKKTDQLTIKKKIKDTVVIKSDNISSSIVNNPDYSTTDISRAVSSDVSYSVFDDII